MPSYRSGRPGAVYLALRGVVFDVSAGAAFYGPGGAYHCFAGREAGRALARSSLDEGDVARGGELGDLGGDELETLARFGIQGFHRLDLVAITHAVANHEVVVGHCLS